MEWLSEVFDFLVSVHWVRVIITILATAVGVVLGIWVPARLLELHTNQPAVRYVWYVMGTLTLIMIYVCMYAYGHFWDLYGDATAA